MSMTRLTPARHEHGFTLVEALAAMLTGMIVIGAAFAILEVSLRQSSRIADRVSADQRARIAMETIMLKLHSSCVSSKLTPVEPGSTGSTLKLISQTGAQPSFATVTLHQISFSPTTGTLVDTAYPSTVTSVPPEWIFSTTASSTTTLLTGVTQTGTTPIFQYFKYEGGALSTTPQTVEPSGLSAAEANETSEVTVSFTTAPESGNVKEHRAVDLTNTAVLRFDPSSATSINYPCA